MKILKSLAIIWIICILISVSIYTNSAKVKLKKISSFGPYLKNHYDLLLPECAERKEKNKYTTHKTFMKTHIVQQTKHQVGHNISRQVNVGRHQKHGIWCDLSMMRISYKMTNWSKTEKIEIFWKLDNIINFTTIRYKLTAYGNFIHQYLITSCWWDRSALYQYIKKKRTGKSSKFKKN